MFIVLFLYLIIIPYDYAVYFNKLEPRGKVVYFTLMLISFYILILHSLEISIPPLGKAIINVLKALLGI